MSYISPAAQKDAATTIRPVSAKKEFEQIIRSIRKIAAENRVFSGNMIQELIKETESAAAKQRDWSWGGSVAQIGLPVAAAVGGAINGKGQDWFQIGSKLGDAAHSASGASQYGYQAGVQKIQQALTQYNAFDQRMQTLIQSIDSAQDRMRQKEMEEAANR